MGVAQNCSVTEIMLIYHLAPLAPRTSVPKIRRTFNHSRIWKFGQNFNQSDFHGKGMTISKACSHLSYQWSMVTCIGRFHEYFYHASKIKLALGTFLKGSSSLLFFCKKKSRVVEPWHWLTGYIASWNGHEEIWYRSVPDEHVPSCNMAF